jgi:Methyltransferase domain
LDARVIHVLLAFSFVASVIRWSRPNGHYVSTTQSWRERMPLNKFTQFPKVRPELPENYQKLYAKEYKANREGKGIASYAAQRLEAWMHHRVASLAGSRQRILEIGAGTLNHYAYELGAAPLCYDIVEPFRRLYRCSPFLEHISAVYNSVSEIPQQNRYDRIISVAVLEHMEDLPKEIGAAKLLLSKGGVFQAGIPCEGGLLWGVAWRLSTGLAFRLRTGLDYKVIMRHEHLNNYDEIVSALKDNFGSVMIDSFPLPFKHFALYSYLECTV